MLRDVKYAWRGLARAPLFTLVAIASIALGIGANTAIFTLVDEVLIRLLPVKAPEQLVLFTGSRNHYGSNSGGNMLSFPMYEDFRDNFVDRGAGGASAGPAPALPRISQSVPNPAPTPKIFSGMFARRPIAMNVGVDGRTERVVGELVSGTYFQVLGVGAAAGRLISPDDDREKNGSHVAVLSYDYWRNRYGADPSIVGRSITINNSAITVIGVSQSGFTGLDIGSESNVFVPITLKAQMTPNWDDMDNRRSRWVNVFARLKPGVTQDQALAVLQPFFHGLLEQEVKEAAFAKTTPYTREQFLRGTMNLLPAAQGRSPIRQQLTQPLWMLFGIVAGVLLIACANVASLLIARATARQKEIALRLALGASRGRIVGQLLVESLTLAAIGGALGLVVAAWTTKFLLGFLPTSDFPHVISGAMDWRVMTFNFALSLATGLLFGLAPALRSTKPDVAPVLKDQAGSVVGGGVRFRKALVVAQVTISILLLIGAGLFIRTLRNLRLVDLGLDTESVVAFNIQPGLAGYTPARVPALYRSLVDRLRAQAGVQSVAFAYMGLLEGNEWDSTMTVEGYQPAQGEQMNPYCNAISPGYFHTMGVPILAGREFDDRDQGPQMTDAIDVRGDGFDNGYRHAIVNESFAKKYFHGREAIGRHIGFGGNPGTPTPIEIVGVVRDSKYTGVRDDIPRQVFFPVYEDRTPGNIVVYLRTTGDPSAAFGAAQRTVRELDANVPVYNLRTLERQIDRSLLVERFIATLSTAFGVLATLLAVIGLYGVMAYTVARRTREIGVRMALGALRGDVVWLVMREVLVLVGTGMAIGLGAAWGLNRVVGNQLYGISATDPATIIGAVSLLGVVAALAGYIPARRATRVNPVLALRYE
ncbi:MAG TPA: ABC transporter permease [Vicinamibacterales bacterium]|nr:ABC transporter permease [Vicinamibacterales bacterium]